MKYSKSPEEYFESLEYWHDEMLLVRTILQKTGLNETIKWGIPVYTFNNENIAGLAAFKSYAGLWFYQGALLKDEKNLLINANEENTKALRQMRITSASDIRADLIEQYIYESVENFKAGIKIRPEQNKPLNIPDILSQKIMQNHALEKAWNSLSLSCKREYSQYVAEAKKVETQINRIEKIIPIIMEGKGLNDKYR